ncbi:MAG: lipocalin family protein, partial [Saprospiraceae bacterium]|nr:lipocalin family protein [Saprospiraceae bacterium]
GQWQGVSWKVQGEESGRDFGAVRFEFKADDTYSAAFGNQLEKGTFRLSGDKLYTTGENKIEKMVKLTTLSADTLVMDMNRVGVSEALVLAKRR